MRYPTLLQLPSVELGLCIIGAIPSIAQHVAKMKWLQLFSLVLLAM